MTFGLSQYGSEYVTKSLFGNIDQAETIEVGLYYDHEDRLTWHDDIDSIDTEPDSGEYERVTYALDGEEVVPEQTDSGHWELEFVERILDTTDTDEIVDSMFIVVEYENVDDDAPTDHLFGAERLIDGDGNHREEHLEDSNAIILRPSIPIS